MSVTNATLRSPATGGYACDGSTTAFAGTFNLLAEGDVDVILTDVNGTESTLTLTTDYTVSPTGGSYPCTAFTVTTVSTYASGNTITLIRSMALTQPTSYGNSGPYYPSIHETSYDRLLLQLQQQQEILDRCVKDAASATATTDPDSYLAACQAAQAAAEAAETGATNANTNLYQVNWLAVTNVDIATALESGDAMDGLLLSAGDRVLLTGQTSAGEDGIYVVPESGAASRAADYPAGTECAGHMFVVGEGSVYAGTVHHVANTTGSDVVGTNGITIYPTAVDWSTADTHLVLRSGIPTQETVTTYAKTILDDTTAAAARTTLGLTSMATMDANAVALTGGTIAGVAMTGSTVTTSGVNSVDDLLYLRDQKAANTAGGDFTQGSWQTRDLNTVVTNTISSSYMLYELDYHAKTGTFQVGETVTDGTSGATAVVYSLSGGSSPLIVYNVSGTFGENNTITGGTSAATASVGDYNLPYDNKIGTFVAGETVTGGTSSATAVIRADWSAGSPLFIDTIVGTFQNNEQITGGTSGATADVNDPQSTNPYAAEDATTGLDYNNAFILPAGTYWCVARAPANECSQHKAKLRQTSATAADTIIGSSARTGGGSSNVQTDSVLAGQFTIADVESFELQHQCQTTKSSNGFGEPTNVGVVEVYSEVYIWKI